MVINIFLNGEAAAAPLARLLSLAPWFIERLCDPAAFDKEDALVIARELKRSDPLFDVKTAEALPDRHACAQDSALGLVIERILEILDVISPSSRLILKLGYLVDSRDPRVSSKASLYVARRVQNVTWLERYLSHPDPRVRANVIQALWAVNTRASRRAFGKTLRDSNNRVVGNALFGLYKLAEAGSVLKIMDLSSHRAASFRATAAWVMGQTGDAQFLGRLQEMASDPEENVRAMALRSMDMIKQNVFTPAPEPAELDYEIETQFAESA